MTKKIYMQIYHKNDKKYLKKITNKFTLHLKYITFYKCIKALCNQKAFDVIKSK